MLQLLQVSWNIINSTIIHQVYEYYKILVVIIPATSSCYLMYNKVVYSSLHHRFTRSYCNNVIQ